MDLFHNIKGGGTKKFALVYKTRNGDKYAEERVDGTVIWYKTMTEAAKNARTTFNAWERKNMAVYGICVYNDGTYDFIGYWDTNGRRV